MIAVAAFIKESSFGEVSVRARTREEGGVIGEGGRGKGGRGFLRPHCCMCAQGGRSALAGSRPAILAVHSHPNGGGGEEEEEEGIFIRNVRRITYLRLSERSVASSRRIAETTTECVSTPFCKKNFPLKDETTSYCRLNLPVWLFRLD